MMMSFEVDEACSSGRGPCRRWSAQIRQARASLRMTLSDLDIGDGAPDRIGFDDRDAHRHGRHAFDELAAGIPVTEGCGRIK